MATEIKPRERTLYDDDFYAWTQAQAALLRDGRFDELDLARLIEEVADMGESEFGRARSRIRTIIQHLLKLERSPARDPRRGWYDTIITQRAELADELTTTLRNRVRADLDAFYPVARDAAIKALRHHGEQTAADAIPESCPYTLEQITGDWLP